MPQISSWLVASNTAFFDADGAFGAMPEVDWSETDNAHIQLGDTVYLYGTMPVQALTHECRVVRVGVPAAEVLDDPKYWGDDAALEDRAGRTWMRLRLIRAFTAEERAQLSVAAMEARGLKRAPQSRMRVPGAE